LTFQACQKYGKFIFSLPGYAYSSTVTAILYVLPLIAKMLDKERAYRIVEAKLGENFKKRSKLTEFTACNITLEDGQYFVNFKDKKVGSSAILTNLLNESTLMISGEDDNDLSEGTFVNVILLNSF
jgi:molybdopterin molybdotransferase